MDKDSIYFPPGIWGKITAFLGKDYWYNRQQLTYLSQVIDLHNSDYKFSSYWLWNPWRQKEQNSWYLNRTLRKHSFRLYQEQFYKLVFQSLS